MSELGEWDDETTAAPEADQTEPDQAAPEQHGEQAQPYFQSLDDFVREIIVPTFRRQVGDNAPYRWSARWWNNPEAVLRLSALWRAWEALRLDPGTGLSVWIRDHADYHLSVLFDPDGPFKRSDDRSTLDQPLPYEPTPPGLCPPN